MNRTACLRGLCLAACLVPILLALGCRPSESNPGNDAGSIPAPGATENAMKALRLRFLTSPPAEYGLAADTNFPRVIGLLMDWPMDDVIVSVVALADGSASLYTTSSFGIVGGIEHPSVRASATQLLRLAERHHDDAVPTNQFPYPDDGRVRFYLKTPDGVRVQAAPLAALISGQDPLAGLWNQAQRLVAELRIAAENAPPSSPAR